MAASKIKIEIHSTWLDTFWSCPAKFMFAYVLGIRRPGSGHTHRGSAYHDAMAHNLKQKEVTYKDLPVQEVLDAYETSWKRGLGEKEIDWREEDPVKIYDGGTRMVQKYMMTLSKECQPFEESVEASAVIPIVGTNFELHLRIDWAGFVLGKARVVDHKTATKKWPDGKALQQVQAFTYPLAYEAMCGKLLPMEFHVNIERAKGAEIDIVPGGLLTPNRYIWFREWWLPYALDAIERGWFPPLGKGWECLSMDTEILTLCAHDDKPRWKGPGEITLEDKIFTLNLETDRTEWQHPTWVFVKEHKGPMVCYEGKSVNFCVTPQNEMLGATMGLPRRQHPFRKKLAEDIEGKDQIFLVSGFMDYYDIEIISDDWLRLSAWAAAEGHFRGDASMVEIAQQRGTLGHQEIEGILNRLGIRYSINTRPSCDNFRLSAEASKELRSLQPDKTIPRWLWVASQRQFDLWLETFGLGDGYKHGRSLVVGQKDEGFIDDLQAIAVTKGYSAVKGDRRISSTGGRYSPLSLTKGRQEVAITSDQCWVRDAYAEEVWDVTVPNGTILTRRGGRTVWMFNCTEKFCGFWDMCVGGKSTVYFPPRRKVGEQDAGKSLVLSRRSQGGAGHRLSDVQHADESGEDKGFDEEGVCGG